MKKIYFVIIFFLFIFNLANAQTPNFVLTSAISINGTTSSPTITYGTNYTVSITATNNGPTGTYDFECDFYDNSGGYLTVVQKQCSLSFTNGQSRTVTFNSNSSMSYTSGSYQIGVIVLYTSCNGCGVTSCPRISPSGGYANPRSVTVISSSCTAVSMATQPTNQSSAIGGTATFSVSVNGTPPFSYFWYKNGVFQTNTTNTSSNSNSYFTPTLSANDNGNSYYCLITNCNNSQQAQSNTAILSISQTCVASTSSFQANTPSTISQGGTVQFQSNANNNPDLWSWTFPGGTPSSSNSQNPLIQYNTPGIYNVTLQAHNSCGWGYPATTNNFITVNSTSTCTTPGTPVFLSASPSSNNVTLNWATGTPTGSATVTYYWAIASASNVTYESNYLYRGTTTSLTATQNSLRTGTNYYWTVKAVTSCNGNASAYPSAMQFTTTAAQTYYISGTVINPTISDLTGGIQNDLMTCNVKIYNAGTNTQVGSVTASGGSFNFTGLQNQNFDIVASYILNGTTYSVKELNVPANTSNLQLRLSGNLIDEIGNYNSTLSNLNCYLDDIMGTVPVNPYIITSSYNYINSQNKIANNQGQVIESLERLCLAERLLKKYYDQAATMNNELVSSSSEFANFVMNMVEIGKCGSAFEYLAGLLIDWFKSAIEIPIDNSGLPNNYKNDFHIALGMIVDNLQGQPISQGTAYDIFKKQIDQTLTNNNLNNIFIANTANEVGNSVYNAQNGIYSGDIQNTVGNLSTTLNNSLVTTAVAQSYAQSYRSQPDLVQILTKISNAALSGSCGYFFYVDLLALGLDAIHFGFLSASIYQCVNRENELAIEANQTITNSFLRTTHQNWNLFNRYIQSARSQGLGSIIFSFENEYRNTISDINAGNTSTFNQHINNLIQLNKGVNDSVLNELNGIRAAIPFSNITDSMYINYLQNTLFSSPFVRYANLAALSYYIEDNNAILRDSLNFHSSNLITADSLMLTELSNIEGLLSSVSTPGYISISESNLPRAMEPNTDFTAKIKIRNYGSSSVSNLYAKISFDGLFVSSVDSVFIGSLNPNQTDSFSFNIHAPSIVDTNSYYSIHFFSNSAITIPLGGAIKSRFRPVAPTLNFYNQVCYGDTLKLFANSTSTNIFYHWIGPNGFTSNIQNPKIAKISLNNMGTYTCYVSSEGLNSSTSSLAVTIIIPVVSITGNLSFCQNSSTTITASGALTYNWSNGLTTPSIAISSPGNYAVIGQSINGCKDTAKVKVIMLPLPTINLNPYVEIYKDGRVILGGNPVASGIGPLSYKWTPGTGLSSDTIANPIASPHFSTIYTLKVTDKNGCYTTNSINVTVIGFYVFPNPTNDILTVYGSKIENDNYQIKMEDVYGRTILTRKVQVNSNSMNEQLSMGKLPNGLYFVLIEGLNSQSPQQPFKIIKMQ